MKIETNKSVDAIAQLTLIQNPPAWARELARQDWNYVIQNDPSVLLGYQFGIVAALAQVALYLSGESAMVEEKPPSSNDRDTKVCLFHRPTRWLVKINHHDVPYAAFHQL